MAGLPLEIEYEIISFIPTEKNIPEVCNNESKLLKQQAIDKISFWYKKRKRRDVSDEKVQWKYPSDQLRNMIIYYPVGSFLSYPEFAIRKLRLWPSICLEGLPPLEIRKKSDVRKWFMDVTSSGLLKLDDIFYIGF